MGLDDAVVLLIFIRSRCLLCQESNKDSYIPSFIQAFLFCFGLVNIDVQQGQSLKAWPEARFLTRYEPDPTHLKQAKPVDVNERIKPRQRIKHDVLARHGPFNAWPAWTIFY